MQTSGGGSAASGFGFALGGAGKKKKALWNSPRALFLWFLFACAYTSLMALSLSAKFAMYLPRLWIQQMWFVRSIAFGVLYGSMFCMGLLITWMCVEGECTLGITPDGEPTNRSVKWRRIFGWLWLAVGTAGLSSVPFVMLVGVSLAWSKHLIAIVMAAIFAFLATVLGLREIAKHLANYYRPKLQKHIVRVLAMVPIYAIDSFFVVCAINPAAEVFLSTLRSFWESYTIHSFVCFLFECTPNTLSMPLGSNVFEFLRASF
eukprot:SAG11_NODE_48_length_20030_cov_232.459084_5_plen_261_part_00